MLAFFTSFLLSLLAWTLLEYGIHAGLGHLRHGRLLVTSEHRKHHKDILYFTPLPLKIRGALPVLLALLAVVGGAGGLAAGLGSVIAVALGWSTYEVLHQFIHVKGPQGPYTRWAARHHLSHHFGHPRANFGVTTSLWDHVFRTYQSVPQVRVPAHRLSDLPWLAVERQGQGPARPHAADYQLTAPGEAIAA
ncbi:MAG TPA: sterol desaturase family protein [Solimonas sp.]|nr:sterol desaturase family protein [Solimonas sp.]